jgi:signal transduction histidine kinase
MKFKLLLLALFFSSFFSTLSYSQKKDKVKIIAKNEKGIPLSNASITIEDNKPCTTDKSGTSFITPTKKLRMPFNVKLVKQGYEIKEVNFYEEDKEIEVIARKSSAQTDFVYLYLLNEDKTPASDLNVTVLSVSYTADVRGMLKIPGKEIAIEQIKIPGKDIVGSEKKGKALYITLRTTEMTDLINQNLSQEELEKLVFNQYKIDFESVTSAILEERQRLEKDNQEIREEIQEITKKLQTESNLTKEHRVELESYILRLEKTLSENSIAFKKTEEKTFLLMGRLKRIIMRKDSVNLVNLKKFQVAEEQRIAAEKELRRNLLAFSVIALALVLAASILYFIAMKFRKQKKNLSGSNKELIALKEQLDKKILEVKKQRDMIEGQNKELDLFVYKASHDIKGPLKSLLGLTTIGMKTITDESSLEIFSHIHKSISKLDSLLSDLLLVSKAKDAAVVKARINLKEKIREVIESLNNVSGFDKSNIYLEIPENFELHTDKNFIYSIFQNFIENALKYYDPQKKDSFLKIKLEDNEESTLISFEDNGLGISKENLDRIFDMFYKVDEMSNGTGLGLYIVKHNIEKLGGKLNVESILGKGSVFTIEFSKELSEVNEN